MDLSLLNSKNWKDRIQFYNSIDWSLIESPTHIQTQISSESTVPALESAIKALLSCPYLDYSNSKNILKHMSQIKLKDLFKAYFMKIYNNDLLDDILNNIKTIKHGKTIQIYVELLKEITKEKGIEYDTNIIIFILGHSDPCVRKEGVYLAGMIYKFLNEKLFDHLSGIKDIQLKEIKEYIKNMKEDIQQVNDIKKENNIETCIKQEDGTEQEVNKKKELINKNEFIKNYKNYKQLNSGTEIVSLLKSASYKERMEGLNNIQSNSIIIDNELQNLIIQKIGDPNLQVTTLAIECSLLLNKSKELLKGLTERFKEKKLKNLILFVMNEKEFENVELSELNFKTNKNPNIKIGILEYFLFNIDKVVIEFVSYGIEDKNKDVREVAFECYKKLYAKGMKNEIPEKIKERIINETKKENNVVMKNNSSKDNLNNKDNVCINVNITNKNDICNNDMKNSILLTNPTEILNYFYDTYSFLKETNAIKRYDAISTSNISNDPNFTKFVVLFKDSFFKITLFFIDELLKKQIDKNEVEDIFNFFINYLGDNKIKDKVKDLILYLFVINDVVLILTKEFICKKKIGKLFCEGVDILGRIASKGDLVFLEKLEIKGKAERDSINQAISNITNKYKLNNIVEEIKNISPTMPAVKQIGGFNNFDIANNGDSAINFIYNKNIQNEKKKELINKEKRKHDDIKSTIIKQKIKNRVKDCKNKEIIFEEFFLSLSNKPTDYKKVLSLFDLEDKVYLSDYIIEFIYFKELIKIDKDFILNYIDQLINLFIEREYILKENECTMLYNVLKNSVIKERLELVYPRSKLRRIADNVEIEELNCSMLSFNINSSVVESPCKKTKKTNIYDKERIDLTQINNYQRSNLNRDSSDLGSIKRFDIEKDSYNCHQNVNIINSNNNIFETNDSNPILNQKVKEYNNQFLSNKYDAFENQEFRYDTKIESTVNFKGKNDSHYNHHVPKIQQAGDVNIDSQPSNHQNNNIREKEINFNSQPSNNFYHSQVGTNNNYLDDASNKYNLYASNEKYNYNDANNNIKKNDFLNEQPNHFVNKNENTINGNIINYINSSLLKPKTPIKNITPDKYKQYKKEFESQATYFDRVSLERIFINLIHSDTSICESAFIDINNIIEKDISLLNFSCNSIISSILIQLNDSLFSNEKLCQLIIRVLDKLCKNKEFVTGLSFGSLRNINTEMINIIKNNKVQVIFDLAGDILLNLCVMADSCQILKVYLCLLEFLKSEQKDVLYKLIWKHSKGIVAKLNDPFITQAILDAVSTFIENNSLKLIKDDIVVMKVMQLHINEICNFYKEKVYEFKIEGLTRRIVDRIMKKGNLEIDEIKKRLDDVRKNNFM